MPGTFTVTPAFPEPNPDPSGVYEYLHVGAFGENVYTCTNAAGTWYAFSCGGNCWRIALSEGEEYGFTIGSWGVNPPTGGYVTDFGYGGETYTGVCYGVGNYPAPEPEPAPGGWFPWCVCDCPITLPEPSYVCGCENCSILAESWDLEIEGSASRDEECQGDADGIYRLGYSPECGWIWTNYCYSGSGDPRFPNPTVCAPWTVGVDQHTAFVSEILLSYSASAGYGKYTLEVTGAVLRMNIPPPYGCSEMSVFRFESDAVAVPPVCNDLMLDAANARKIKSAGGGCTLSGLGNRITITGGTGWTIGCYKIIAGPDAEGWTELLTAPGPAGSTNGQGGMMADCVRPFLGPDGRLSFNFIEEQVIWAFEPGHRIWPVELSGATIKATLVAYQEEP